MGYSKYSNNIEKYQNHNDVTNIYYNKKILII